MARADTRLHATPLPAAQVVLRVEAADMVQAILCTVLEYSHVYMHGYDCHVSREVCNGYKGKENEERVLGLGPA
jgi:hypothetical protein